LQNINFLYDQLVSQGIFIRKFKEKKLSNYLRFSIGTKEENTKFIKIVEEVMSNGTN
jgi:histidinol-phosphate/aromatic aminotransferase/cobyric acid decarboxylase-like protein